MSLERVRTTDIVSPKYSSNTMPNLIREQRPPGLNIVIYRTSPGSTAPADKWIINNYGLSRYKEMGVPLTVHNAWESKAQERLEGLPIILTTGSIVDLGKADKYLWIQRFRDSVLGQAIHYQWPVLAPCFGMAELAQLYAEPDQDAFPKGIRQLGRKPIEVVGKHPIFYGLKNITGYAHHNGSIPFPLFEANADQMRIHAITQNSSGEPLPALVTFGGLTTVGTSIHREILDEEVKFLFLRKAASTVAKYVDVPTVREALLHEIDSANTMRPLQTMLNRHQQEPPNVLWMDEFLAGSEYDPESDGEGYNRLASFVFFDNLLRLAIMQRLGLPLPETGIGESIELHASAQREKTPLYGFVKEGKLFTAEIAGTSNAELQELSELYIHGFGGHLPMSIQEHRDMAKKGDVITIRNAKGELVATRAMVYSANDSNPYDKHVGPQHAYQNHTIVHSDWRGKGLIEEMTAIASNLALQSGKIAVIASVKPENIANLRALTRQGYRLTIYSNDHFGQAEDRYMLELPLKTQGQDFQKGNSEMFTEENTPVYTGNSDKLFFRVETTGTDNATRLLDQGYKGVSTLVTGKTNYLVFQKESVQ